MPIKKNFRDISLSEKKPSQTEQDKAAQIDKEKKDKELDDDLKHTFPASDPTTHY